MPDAGGLVYIVLIAVSFIIGVFITRWVFGIEIIIDNLKKQTDFLEEQNRAMIDQRAILKLLLIDRLSDNRKIEVTDKKDGKIIYPTLRDWIEKYSSDRYTTEIIKN